MWKGKCDKALFWQTLNWEWWARTWPISLCRCRSLWHLWPWEGRVYSFQGQWPPTPPSAERMVSMSSPFSHFNDRQKRSLQGRMIRSDEVGRTVCLMHFESDFKERHRGRERVTMRGEASWNSDFAIFNGEYTGKAYVTWSTDEKPIGRLHPTEKRKMVVTPVTRIKQHCNCESR